MERREVYYKIRYVLHDRICALLCERAAPGFPGRINWMSEGEKQVKKRACVLLLVMTALLLAGCGSQNGQKENATATAARQAAGPRAETVRR